jgi:hypothetical protein
MKDQLVTKETAILAKLKNFDGMCFAGYDVGITNPLWLHSDGKFQSLCYRDKSTVTEDCILVPTQALLQKWLRIKHKIHVGIDYDDNGWAFFFLADLTNSNEISWSKNYKEYEEALEAGLLKALNEIQI